jgi:hypothetical protein
MFDSLVDFFNVFTIPILIGVVVFLLFGRVLKKAIIAGLVAVIILMFLGVDLKTIFSWFTSFW